MSTQLALPMRYGTLSFYFIQAAPWQLDFITPFTTFILSRTCHALPKLLYSAVYVAAACFCTHRARFSWWEAQINCGCVLWSIMVYYGLLRSLNVSMTLKVYYARYVAYITESTMQRYCACPSVCLPVLSSFSLTSMRPLRRTSQVTRQTRMPPAYVSAILCDGQLLVFQVQWSTIKYEMLF